MRIITALPALAVLVLLAACELPLTNPDPEPRYTVSYHANGADSGTVPLDSRTYLAGDIVTVRANQGQLARTYFGFGGWNTAADGKGTTLSPGEVLPMGKKNLDFFAFWIAQTHEIRFEPNGGSGTMAELSQPFGKTFALPAVTFTKTGYAFQGWSLFSTGAGSRFTDTAEWTMGDQPVTLYAVWVPRTYQFHFHPNGGTGAMEPQTFEYGTSVSLTKENFTNGTLLFSGWSILPGGPPVYPDNASLSPGPSDLELYACWSSSITLGWGPYSTLTFTPTTATVNQGQPLTLEAAAEGGTQWRWYVDNILVQGETGSTYSFSSATPGHYLVSVFTTVSGVGYSGTITIHVNQ